MSYLSPLDKIKSARVRLIRRHPFYGFLAMYLKPREDKDVPTMGVDRDGNLYYNPEYVKSLDVDVLQVVVSHEILHLALLHPFRRGKRDKMLWNLAADFAVNSILAGEFGESRIISLGAAYSPKFKDMSAEEIYDQLRKMAKKGMVKIVKNGNGKGRYEVSINGIGTFVVSDHGKWEEGGKGRLAEDVERKAKEWSKRVVEAYEYAKSVGKDPLGIRKIVEAMLKPPSFNWRELLRKFIQDLIPNDYTWLRPHKKSFSTGFYLPAVRKEESIELAIVLDTSGSISDDEYRDFMSEVFHILRSFRSVKAHFIMCDAEVAKTFDCENVEDAVKMLEERAGYGGTDTMWASLKCI